MHYRREIDGLRAVAVLPVILFHAGFPAFSGGFVGVDVFFVISGYLITSLIVAERQAGSFSILKFYERRARRILPALLVVMAACIPFAWLWLLPPDLYSFSGSLIAVSAFVSNLFFWQESGYFDTGGELKPLLHTWSLAVEEQFYLFFPAFFVVAWRWGRRWFVAALAVAAMISLALAQWGAYNKPDSTFYLLPTRGWELMIGALLVFCPGADGWLPGTSRLRHVMDAIGLVLIACAVFGFGPDTPFPSLYALVPTIGTALVIMFATPDTVVGRILASKALVTIGLISYSAYLWHQPMFAFARYRLAEEPGTLAFILLSLSAVALAYASWRYVEQPFRRRDAIGRNAVFAIAGAGGILFAALGLTGVLNNGFESRYSPEQRRIAAFITYDKEALYRYGECFKTTDDGPVTGFSPTCIRQTANGRIDLLWGDSHAAALSHGLSRVSESFASFAVASCAPLLPGTSGMKEGCWPASQFVLDQIERLQPARIFLHARWNRVSGIHMGPALVRTIDRIMELSPGSRIYVIGSVPQWRPNLPRILLLKQMTLERFAELPSTEWSSLETADTEIRTAVQVPRYSGTVQFVSILDTICSATGCAAVVPLGDSFQPLVFDFGHLTEGGSRFVASALANQVAPSMPTIHSVSRSNH